MCIQKRLEEIEKEIEAKLKVKTLLKTTQPLLASISSLCADYQELAPEELPFLMEEIWYAAQVDKSVAAVTAIAATGDEKAQNFALDAMAQAITQRASVAFSAMEATAEPEAVQQQNFAPEPEYEPEECTDTIQEILGSRGFYEPDINLAEIYDPKDKQASYDGWDIYCHVHDNGLAMSIGLGNEKLNQFWDVGTEYLHEHDPNFPESLSEKQPILAWVRGVIDLLPTVSVLEAPEVPGQLALEFPNTSLQKLLAEKKNSEFIFEPSELTLTEFGVPVLVVISSTQTLETLPDDEKAQFEIAIFRGNKQGDREKATYCIDASTFLYQWGRHGTEAIRSIAKAQVIRFGKELAENGVNAWWRNSNAEAPNLIEKFSITNLPLPHQEMRARVMPATGDRPPFLGKFAGATFTFYRGTEELFTTSQTAEQIARGENNPELIAVSLAIGWLRRQELKNVSPAGTTHTEPRAKDDFTELVYLRDDIAYLKRKDSGEILTAYLGFSNKTSDGNRAPTMAKSRATKWQEHLVGVYQLACSGPRECQRIESKNPKQPFKYELKLTKPPMGQLQGLATENFGLYPNEIEVEQKHEGSEARSELLTPPPNSELANFEFVKIPDFDLINPEYQVLYQGVELTNIWNSLRAKAGHGQQAERLWRHKLLKPGEEIELKDREAAALHALQRTRGLA